MLEESAAPEKAFKEVPPTATARLTWQCGDERIEYTATAGHTHIREDDGSPIGSMFAVSYMAVDGQGNPDPARPLTFCFNGGPGSASILINVGGMGPRYVVPNGDRRIGPAPFDIQDNPYTLLRISDMVIVDALGTGWSVLADGVPGERAYTLQHDAECFMRFIIAWLEENRRWNSPLYLLGESYGTTRAAVLSNMLDARGIPLNGVTMLSAHFDWTTVQPGNDRKYVQLFPAYASIAQYHGRARAGEGVSSEEFFDDAAAFAEQTLEPALLQADRLSPEVEADLAARMSDYLGLSADFIAAHHLRVELTDFRQELLRDQNLACGRLDGRFTFERGNFLQVSAEGESEIDPSDIGLRGAWHMAWRHHLGEEIGYANPRPHATNMWATIGVNWVHRLRSAGVKWGTEAPNVAYDLADVMRHNPHMKVLVLGGRYDLATPYLGPVQDMAHMFLGPQIKANLTWRLYDSGHMIYVNPVAAEQLDRDLREFYQA